MLKKKCCSKIVYFIMMIAVVCTLQSSKSMAATDFDIDVRGYVTYKGNAAVVTVPATVDGTQVKGINASGFMGKANLQQVTLPNTVEEISDDAFVNCTSLTTINLPEGLTTIGERAFMRTALTNVTLPSTLKNIKYRAFEEINTLNAINIPGLVKEIGPRAFYKCANLQTVTFNNGLERIKDNAFGRTKVNTVVIPDSVVELESNVFFSCSELTSITLSSNLRTLGTQTFMNTGLTSITIPGGVTQIGPRAFQGATSLEEVIIEDGVEDVLIAAFNNCTSLRRVELPNTLKMIGEYAFGDCDLTQVNFPQTLISVGSNAFFRNENLTRAEFPTVESYNPEAFNSCNIIELTLPYTDRNITDTAPVLPTVTTVSIDYGDRAIETVFQDDWIDILKNYGFGVFTGITTGIVFNNDGSRQVKPGPMRTSGQLASFELIAVGQAGEVVMDPPFQSTHDEYDIKVPQGTTTVQLKFSYEKLKRIQGLQRKEGTSYVDYTSLPTPVFGIYTMDWDLIDGQVELRLVSFDPGSKSYIFKIKEQPLEKGGEIENIYSSKGSLNPSFNKTITSYGMAIPADKEEFEINYINNANTTVTMRIPARNQTIVSGEKIAFNGDEEVIVEVVNTPIVGDSTTYTIRVVKSKPEISSNTNLADVILDPNLTLTPNFSKDIKTYTATAGADYEYVSIYGVPEDSRSTATRILNRTLVAGLNTYAIKVISEAGTEDTYTFNINRAASSNLDLKSVMVDGRVAIKEEGSEVYKIEVDKPSVDISVKGVRIGTSFDKVFPYNANLNEGNNTINITATAENGDTKTYQIIIKKVDRVVLSSNANLSNIELTRGDITFNKYIREYSVIVDDNINILDVIPVLEDKDATYTMSDTSLNYGNNIIDIIVTAQNGNQKKYVLNVKRRTPLNNADLKSLLTNTGTFNRPFDPDVTEYDIQVDYSIADISFYAEALDDEASVVKTTTKNLEMGTNIIPITVTARNGISTKTYTITVVRLAKNDDIKSTNARLGLLKPSVGALEPVFQPGKYNYSLTVDADVNTVSFDGYKQHPRATVTFPPAKAIVRGTENVVNVNVTAEDGITTNTYKISITKKDADNRPYMSIMGPSTDITIDDGSFTIQGGLKCITDKSVTLSATIGGVTKSKEVRVTGLTTEQMNSNTEKGTAWELIFPYSELVKDSYDGVTVTYTDGTTGIYSEEWNYILSVNDRSNTAPTITITQPAANINISTGNFVIRGTYSDLENDTGMVYATINGVRKEVEVTGDSWELSWFKRELAEQDYTNIEITAEDSRGGTKSTTLPYTLTVEAPLIPNRAPKITVETPNGDVGLRTGSFILSGKVSDEDDQTVTVSATMGRTTKTVNIDNTITEKTWSLEWTRDELMPDSYFNIEIEALDTDGGRSTVTWIHNLTVEDIMPTVSVRVKVDGSFDRGIPRNAYIDAYPMGAEITDANRIGRYDVVDGNVNFGTDLDDLSQYIFIIDSSTIAALATRLNGRIADIENIGFPYIHLGDFNSDGNINGTDFANFQQYFIDNSLAGDLNGDDEMDGKDFALFAQSFLELNK